MKNTVLGFSQEKLLEYKLNISEIHILQWFVDCIVGQKLIQTPLTNNTPYYLVRYQYVIDSLPLLGIHNPRVIARHFNALCKCGLLDKKIEKNKEGTSIYFSYSRKKIVELLYSDLKE
ncbi:hypothetical protein K7J14_07200 [Treponema zuelzerae]|uniref:Uncharacterized protein n=1 Tax=Teretinema zuelzerae TaxID=156 RepID=A0AAE3JJQ5_9SPIR|nr:hypothetical protein [Teretinema zuelzerae]MCD1654426.1 hypothetical protein [Teretinema zuelzerae]MCD1654490.1 hypothetical protein [Teretinema zuelzerae]